MFSLLKKPKLTNDKSNITCKEIGTANDDIERGVISASYINA